MNLQELKKEIPFKWRVQQFFKENTKARCVAYIDARQVMDILDEVVGPENWQSDFKEFKGNIYAGIGILCMKGKDLIDWVWKWDCGAESNIEKEKGEASDAFKRAAVHWGIGRFLYELDILIVAAKPGYTGKGVVVTYESGKELYSNDEITDYCNHLRNKNKPIETKQEETKESQMTGRQEEKKPIDVKEKFESTNGTSLGDKLILSHLISDKEKQTWEKNKTDIEKRKKALDYLTEKIHYGETIENELYIKHFAKIKEGETKKDIKEKVRKLMIKDFTPLTLAEVKKKFPKTEWTKEEEQK